MTVLDIEVYGAGYKIEDPKGVIGRALQSGEPYEAKVLYHIYRKNLDGLAVDVGAGVGNHSLFLACVCGLDVLSFEPIEYDRLIENIKLNNLRNKITPMRLALSNKPGRARYLGQGRLRTSLTGPIPVGTLDEFGLTDVSLLKIDVEGFEDRVLEGSVSTIRRCKPIIYAEAQTDEHKGLLRERLEPMNYEYTRSFGATPLLEWMPRD